MGTALIVLFIDAAVGTSEFDKAFRREIKKVYSDKDLKPLPPDHPMFNFVSDARKVRLSSQAATLFPGLSTPALEAIEVDGLLPVVYSRLSLSAGWEKLPRAYNVGYADEDAVKVGVNALMYLVTH